jgi:SAM-dependent methyltransferase
VQAQSCENRDKTMEADILLKPVTSWIPEDNLKLIYSSEYWTDIAEEKKKAWWIAEENEGTRQRLRLHLEDSGVMADYRIAEQSISQLAGNTLAVADIAAGIGWTSVLMSKLPNIGSVHAVDISRHRLELLFPKAVRMFDGNAAKLNRYIGSFYELGFADSSMDVVFLSQAFHHAASPIRLLAEIDRILKPGGRLMLIGENFISAKGIIKRMLKTMFVEKRFCSDFSELFPPDNISGDHYYRLGDYRLFLRLLGFKVVTVSVQKRKSVVIIAEKLAG